MYVAEWNTSILSVDDAVENEGEAVSRSIREEWLYIYPSQYAKYGGRSFFITASGISVVQKGLKVQYMCVKRFPRIPTFLAIFRAISQLFLVQDSSTPRFDF